MQLDSVVDVRKKLKCDFSTFIGNKKINLFTYFSGFVAELSNSSRENNDEYVVEAFMKVGQLDELKVIQIEKNIEVINMLLDESSSSLVEVNSCLAIEGRDNSNICGYLLYAEDIDANTGTVLKNENGEIFPITLHYFSEFYGLHNISLNINKNNIFFSANEVDSILKDIKQKKLERLKLQRISNLGKANEPIKAPKQIGIEYAKKLWAESPFLSKNKVAEAVQKFLQSKNFRRVSTIKTIATKWLIAENIPDIPEHTSKAGRK